MADYIINGTLIDGTGAPPVPLHWLAIADGRIVELCVAEAGRGGGTGATRVPLRPDANGLLDAADMTVMPGLIDSHCHLSYGDARSIEEQDLWASAEYRTLRAAWHAGRVLRAGVTSVSDPGGSWQIAVAVRDAIKAGMFPGPRISAAGRYLTTHTGLADYFPVWVGEVPSGVGALTKGVEEMLNEVRKQAKHGVDFIKVAASGESSVLTPGGGSVPAFRREELAVIVDESHRLGKRVTAHARSGVAVIDCIEAGMDWIMHGDYMTREQADRLAASGIPLCPALTLLVNTAEWGHIAGCSAARIDRTKRNVDQAVDVLSYAHRQGVTMMCGTDSGFAITPFGEWHARELEIFVKYLGMTPMEAIVCGTKNAAFALDATQVGTLEQGKWADVLIVDGDPLQDIRILQDKAAIHAVFKGGEPVELTHKLKKYEKYPWERILAIAGTELHYEHVYGTPSRARDPAR